MGRRINVHLSLFYVLWFEKKLYEYLGSSLNGV